MTSKITTDVIYEALHTANKIGVHNTIKGLRELTKTAKSKEELLADFIIKSCCAQYKISFRALFAKKTKDVNRDYCLCVIAYLLSKREYCAYSQEEIGLCLNGLDRPNVSRRINRYKAFTKKIKNESDALYITELVEADIRENFHPQSNEKTKTEN